MIIRRKKLEPKRFIKKLLGPQAERTLDSSFLFMNHFGQIKIVGIPTVWSRDLSFRIFLLPNGAFVMLYYMCLTKTVDVFSYRFYIGGFCETEVKP